MYKLSKSYYGNQCVIKNCGDGLSFVIPFEPDNTDAKEFAKWLSEGGVPEAAVEGETVSAEWIAETIAKLS
jgi:acylphosphatase